MKKHIIISSSFLFIFCSFFNVSSQEKKITEQQMTAHLNNAHEKLKNKSYRVKTISQSYTDKGLPSPYYSINITEHVPPDSYHSITERKSSQGTIREEIIAIGEKKFILLNNGTWNAATSAISDFRSGDGFRISLDDRERVRYKYKGRKNINNQSVDLYEIKSVKRNRLSFKENLVFFTEEIWFNQEGLLLKIENNSEDDKGIAFRTIRDYEYDPNIKIEAPIK